MTNFLARGIQESQMNRSEEIMADEDHREPEAEKQDFQFTDVHVEGSGESSTHDRLTALEEDVRKIKAKLHHM